MNDDRYHDRIAELHARLEATQERPVERSASRWIGEAEAIAADLVTADVTAEVHHKRLSHIRDLLANVERTEDSMADDHVATAKRITHDLLTRYETRGDT